ncbi:hypothetical protein ACRDU6_10360 [Mycolicibacterium sp. ELW1]|jgi:hypothetical protein|uniref:hypothetical protein n=1 Tax=Mycobacteriaceae TaxID=1762 RepID=UPI0011F098FB|nr:hypothetical protein [Mycobacterium sp. ELW1]QEN13022.1 hypothetical protein D3H54_06915 [Mycobacterium sp. ELW1]
MWRQSGLVVAALLTAVSAGCGARDSHPAPTTAGAVLLNNVSVAEVLNAITKAKLPAVNARDETASTCPTAGCLEATDTDTVSILKFPSTGRAELYAAAVPDMLQVEDIVVVFAPTLTSEQKTAYGQAVKNAMR